MAAWIVDRRVGMIAVYRAPKVNCIYDLAEGDAVPFVRRGFRTADGWRLPRRFVWAAHFLAWRLNCFG